MVELRIIRPVNFPNKDVCVLLYNVATQMGDFNDTIHTKRKLRDQSTSNAVKDADAQYEEVFLEIPVVQQLVKFTESKNLT